MLHPILARLFSVLWFIVHGVAAFYAVTAVLSGVREQDIALTLAILAGIVVPLLAVLPITRWVLTGHWRWGPRW